MEKLRLMFQFLDGYVHDSKDWTPFEHISYQIPSPLGKWLPPLLVFFSFFYDILLSFEKNMIIKLKSGFHNMMGNHMNIQFRGSDFKMHLQCIQWWTMLFYFSKCIDILITMSCDVQNVWCSKNKEYQAELQIHLLVFSFQCLVADHGNLVALKFSDIH